MTALEAIESIISEKRRTAGFPECAMLQDVARLAELSKPELRQEMGKLQKGGLIYFKQTINSFGVYLKNS